MGFSQKRVANRDWSEHTRNDSEQIPLTADQRLLLAEDESLAALQLEDLLTGNRSDFYMAPI